MKKIIILQIVSLFTIYFTSFSQGTISAGGSHGLSICTDQTVRAWGRNTDGRCGDGTTTTATTPVTVVTGASGCATNLCSITKVAAGNDHSVALKSDGTVWTWGNNASGQLGDNTTTNRSSAVQVLAGASGCATNLCNITAIAAGISFTVALKSDGTVWAWGVNGSGQLGDGTTTSRSTPVQVSGLTNITAIAVGSFSNHALALKNDGTLWAWGTNTTGQLGDNTTTNRTTPVQVLTGASGCATNLCNITSMTTGSNFSLAVKSDGSVWGWGDNTQSQLADGTTTQRNTPVQILTGASGCTTYLCNVTKVTAGVTYSIALKSDGTVWGWGLNSSGQLGDNSTTNRTTPVQVLTGASGCVTNLCNIKQISAGPSSTFAFKSNNTIWGWGTNGAFYRLGDGTTTNRSTAVAPSGICSVIALPVELMYFNANCSVNKKVTIEWGTATEKNNNYFIVEKSCDGINFEFLAKIPGAGDSQTIKKYEFVDENYCQGVFYYRLSQTDYDGQKNTFEIISANCLTDENQVYPNPTKNIFYLNTNKSVISNIKLYTSTGDIIRSYDNEIVEKHETKSFNTYGMSPGVYFLHYILEQREVKIQKLIIY